MTYKRLFFVFTIIATLVLCSMLFYDLIGTDKAFLAVLAGEYEIATIEPGGKNRFKMKATGTTDPRLSQPIQAGSALKGDSKTLPSAPMAKLDSDRNNTVARQRRELLKKLEVFYSELPRKSDLGEYTDEELHHQPPKFFEVGERFGYLFDQAKDNPALAADIADFFRQCALSTGILVSLRALCLRNHDELGGKDPSKSLDKLPQEVKALREAM